MIQEAHHRTCSVVNINRTVKNQQIRLQHGRNQRFQFPVMGTVAKIRFEAGIAAETGLIKIPRQEKFPNFPSHFIGKFSCYHAGISFMILSVDHSNFHFLIPHSGTYYSEYLRSLSICTYIL